MADKNTFSSSSTFGGISAKICLLEDSSTDFSLIPGEEHLPQPSVEAPFELG